jgi:hypothetical protein
MISITSTVNRAWQILNRFAAKFPNGTMRVLEATAKRVQKRMNVEGDEITYPVNWDSAKQRRAWFATNGFGKGIPYQRTFGSASTWQVQTFAGGVSLSAPHPAGAVSGMPNRNWWQSRIHRGRWPWLKTELYAELARLPAEIMDALTIAWNEAKQ